MSFKNVNVMLVGMALVLSACTSRNQQIELTPPQKTEQSSNQQGGQNQNQNGNGDQGKGLGDQSGAVGIVLSKDSLQKYAVNLDNLSYKFSYLGQERAEKITFDATGKAQLKFSNLPSDQAGTVVLEVLEGQTIKLRGSVENVTLKKGENTTVALTLKVVDAGNGGNGNTGNDTTDLTIDVTLDNDTGNPNSGGSGNGTGSGSGSGTGSGTGSGAGSGSGSGSDTTTVDPIATWDGKSNLGNSKWSVTPVVQGAAALH